MRVFLSERHKAPQTPQRFLRFIVNLCYYANCILSNHVEVVKIFIVCKMVALKLAIAKQIVFSMSFSSLPCQHMVEMLICHKKEKRLNACSCTSLDIVSKWNREKFVLKTDFLKVYKKNPITEKNTNTIKAAENGCPQRAKQSRSNVPNWHEEHQMETSSSVEQWWQWHALEKDSVFSCKLLERSVCEWTASSAFDFLH